MTALTAHRDPYMRPQLTHPILSADEERELTEAAAAGSESARAELVERNLRLVARVAGRRKSSRVPFEDLYQEGVLGLMSAAENFDPSRGFRFTTFAARYVEGYVARAASGGAALVRTPMHARQWLRRYDRAAARPGMASAGVEAVAAAAGIPARSLPCLRDAIKARSVVAGGGDGPGSRPRWDFAAPEPVMEPAAPPDFLARALSLLPDRDAAVVRAVAVEGRTFREAAVAAGVSDDRTRQTFRLALAWLKRSPHVAALAGRTA